MDPGQFLDTACDLLARSTREADLRSCASRAYYCVYHVAKAAVQEGVEERLLRRAQLAGRITHAKLIECLKEADDAEVNEAGDELRNLKEAREAADYDCRQAFGRTQAEQAVDDAKDQRATLDGLTPGRIGKAVTVYLRKIYR